MKLEREVIVDLLPAYFSAEASAATRSLVEDYFREHPDFERAARDANGPLESLKVPSSALDDAREKLAFERARQVTEARSSYLWLAVFFTAMLLLFRIHDHKLIWVLWDKSAHSGVMLGASAVLLWLLFFNMRRRKEPMRAHTKFLWLAVFYTLLLGFFKVNDHKIVWIFFDPDPNSGLILSFMAATLWINYFFQRWKAKRDQLQQGR